MATAVAPRDDYAKPTYSLPGRKYDHYFFSAMALSMLVTVFLGFARTYYLAGVFNAPLPSFIIHIHGAAFTCWILLLVTQTSLVAAGRVDIHRKLGIAGFLLAAGMTVLGVLAATDSLVRHGGPPGRDTRAFYIVPMMAIFIFAVLIALAFLARKNSSAHKRYIMLATSALLVAAIARWPFPGVFRNALHATLISFLFVAALVVYDWWSTHKVHRVTLGGGFFLIAMSMLRLPIGHTAAWHSFAGWVESIAHGI